MSRYNRVRGFTATPAGVPQSPLKVTYSPSLKTNRLAGASKVYTRHLKEASRLPQCYHKSSRLALASTLGYFEFILCWLKGEHWGYFEVYCSDWCEH